MFPLDWESELAKKILCVLCMCVCVCVYLLRVYMCTCLCVYLCHSAEIWMITKQNSGERAANSKETRGERTSVRQRSSSPTTLVGFVGKGGRFANSH